MCTSDNCCAEVNPVEVRRGVHVGCLGRMLAYLGRCSTLLENMLHFMRFQSIQDALPKSVKHEAKTVRDSPGWSLRCVSAACAVVGEWGFFEPACGGGAINRLYTPCTRKGRGKFDRYAQSAEAKK